MQGDVHSSDAQGLPQCLPTCRPAALRSSSTLTSTLERRPHILLCCPRPRVGALAQAVCLAAVALSAGCLLLLPGAVALWPCDLLQHGPCRSDDHDAWHSSLAAFQLAFRSSKPTSYVPFSHCSVLPSCLPSAALLLLLPLRSTATTTVGGGVARCRKGEMCILTRCARHCC